MHWFEFETSRLYWEQGNYELYDYGTSSAGDEPDWCLDRMNDNDDFLYHLVRHIPSLEQGKEIASHTLWL